MQGRDLNEQRDCGESGKSQRYRCRDDHEWEGGVWVGTESSTFLPALTNTT